MTNKTKNSQSMILVVTCISFFAAFAGGWCANVYKIFTTGLSLAEFGGMEIARIIGIFVAPLGAVLGFF